MSDKERNFIPNISIKAEQVLIGSVLLGLKPIADVKPQGFYVDLHKDIFNVAAQLFTAGQPIDLAAIIENCVKSKVFDKAEDAKLYLDALVNMAEQSAES